jgi:hypothetical protein
MPSPFDGLPPALRKVRHVFTHHLPSPSYSPTLWPIFASACMTCLYPDGMPPPTDTHLHPGSSPTLWHAFVKHWKACLHSIASLLGYPSFARHAFSTDRLSDLYHGIPSAGDSLLSALWPFCIRSPAIVRHVLHAKFSLPGLVLAICPSQPVIGRYAFIHRPVQHTTN